ncbi:MAG: VCBS repeat-containing protein [Verrucomicrobiales bacterium]
MKTPPSLPVLVIVVSIALPTGFTARAEPWARHTIDAADKEAGRAGADGVRLGDLNGDGLADIVTGWEEGDAIRVCLNPGPDKARQPWPAVTVGRVTDAEDAVFADLDGDGFLDVVSAAEGKTKTVYIHWCPSDEASLANESAWTTTPIPVTESRKWWMYTLPFDVDDDGDTDLIVGSKNKGGSVAWLENPGHAAARRVEEWQLHHMADAAWIMSLRLLESGGDNYLLFSDRKGDRSGIYLMKSVSEEPWFEPAVRIGAAGEEVMFLDLAHLNDDDRLDIAAAIRPDRVMVLNQPEDPLREWSDVAELEPLPGDRYGTTKAVSVALMDRDEQLDFVITCELAKGDKHGVAIGNPSSKFQSVSGPEGVKFDRIELLDLDGDGDLDILTCEERDGLGVVWYENPSK